MSDTKDYAIGVDLGGTSIKFVVVDPAGGILQRFSRDTGDRQTDPSGNSGESGDPVTRWAETIRHELQEIQTGQGVPARCIGLAAPGLAARDGRSIACMPGRLSGLEGLDWTDWLGALRPIPVLNDTHAALVGEAWIGAAAGLKDVVLLTLGTGVGGAVLANGELLQGHIGRAGHLGHTCLDPDGPPDITGTPGSLEDAIGNATLEKRSGGLFTSTRELVEEFQRGDSAAEAIWWRSVRALGCAITSFVNILDPQVVVLGGGIARAGPALFDLLQEVLDETEWRPQGHQVEIRAARLGEYAGALGAAYRALR